MEVPLMTLVALALLIPADVINIPGAKISTHEPRFENVARASVAVDAATVIADGALAGEV
jgi:hypothetical protein